MFEILGALAFIAAVVTLAGQVAKARLRRRHRPGGRLVDIGGHRLHVEIRDAVDGGPVPDRATIVLEGGTWAPGAYWAPVADRLARHHRVVTYDRAGLGWSDPSPRPRTADVMADELHALLGTAAIPGPYLLVGHSFGGSIVRVFAARHPELVAGVVLLDAAHEDQFARAPQSVRAFTARMTRMMGPMFALLGLAGRAGLLALRPQLVPGAAPGLPADVVATIRAQVATRAGVIRTMADEMASLDAGNAAIRALAPDLGDVPLVVVSHGRPEGTPPQLGSEVADEMERLWQTLQAELAASSTRSVRRIAAGIGHDIPTEAPDLVAEAVGDVVRMARDADRPVLATA